MRDTGGKPYVQKKLFGPFKGLNGSQSPFLRELPPSPNAAPAEFAAEFLNLIIDQKTQELVARYGIEKADKGSADPALLEIQASAGLFKWVDYDAVTGKPRERVLNMVVDELGVPTVYAYRLILTEIRPTSATLNGMTLGIIEDPDAADAKRFVIYNTDGSVYASASSITGLANTSVTYVDYDADVDGTFLAGAVDLVVPTELNYNAANASLTTAIQFYSLARKGTTNGELNLIDWIETLDTTQAAHMSAAQSAGVMYFSGGGVCPVLKYDGQNIYKAGMPNAGIAGNIVLTETDVLTFEGATGRTVLCEEDLDQGLITQFGYGAAELAAGTNVLSKAMYVQTFEHGDAKGNYIEGDTYIPAIPLSNDIDNFELYDRLKNTEPVTYTLDNVYDTNADGIPNSAATLLQYEPQSLLANTGYDARGALPDFGLDDFLGIVEADLVDETFTVVVNPLYNTLKKGDIVCFRAQIIDNTVTPAAGGYGGRFIPVLITTKLHDWEDDLLTFSFSDIISLELVYGGDFEANSRGPIAVIRDSDDEITTNSVSSESEITLPEVPAFTSLVDEGTTAAGESVVASLLAIGSWQQLFAWTWGGRVTGSSVSLTEEFAISNNLRVNVYRNKCDRRLGNVPVFDPVPELYLLNILPNNPFDTTTAIGDTFDNCSDLSLGPIFNPKTTLIYENSGLLPGQFLDDPNYTTLPRGRWVSSYKGRVYIADDFKNENILWRSSLLYGPEYYNPEDALNMESPQGDSIKAVLGNDEAIFVLKDESLKVILNDFTNTNIRVDELVLGDDGCIAPLSACQLENGVVYLTSTGPAWVQYTKELVYLGSNPNGVSRIRDRLVNDTALDLKRAVGTVDSDKQHYKLYIPKANKPSSGLYNPTDESVGDAPDYTDQGVMFVFDYANDAWFEQSGINARAGMVMINEGNRMFYLTSYGYHDETDGSSIEWVLYRDRNYDNLLAYTDRVDLAGVETLKAIPCDYTTDWLSFEDPNELKNFLRCKVYGLQVDDTISYLGTSATEVEYSGDYTLTVKAYKDWRDNYVQSEATLSLTSANLYDFMKCRSNKAGVMKFKITHSASYSCPHIQAIEVEAVSPFKAKMKPWGTP